jgi:hypothetical protein
VSEGSVDIDQVALTLLCADDEKRVVGEYAMTAGYGWDDPADKAAYHEWRRATLRVVHLMLAAQRTGQPLPTLEAPPRPRGPEQCGATALNAEPVLLPSPLGVEADLHDLTGEEVTLTNAPAPVVDLAMSIAELSSDLDEPTTLAALQVWSACQRPQGEWWSRFYGALARPHVEYEVDYRGGRRATLRWTAMPWAGCIELPYGGHATLEVDEAACALSGIRDYAPPTLPLPAATTG